MIQDSEVPAADPEQLIKQYMPFIIKKSKTYRRALQYARAVDLDDLIQAGRIAIVEAQKRYDPAGNASFMTYAGYWIKNLMLKTLGMKSNGEIPLEPTLSLDEPIDSSEPGGARLMDVIPDLSAKKREENNEMRQDLIEAINRLPSEKSKAVIKGLYLMNLKARGLAEILNCTEQDIAEERIKALHKLRLDYVLQKYRPSFHVGVISFRNTHTSIVEKEILWRENMINSFFGKGAYFEFGRPQSALTIDPKDLPLSDRTGILPAILLK